MLPSNSLCNQPVGAADQVQQLVEKSGLDQQLQISVQRNGQTLKLAVRPEQLQVQTE